MGKKFKLAAFLVDSLVTFTVTEASIAWIGLIGTIDSNLHPNRKDAWLKKLEYVRARGLRRIRANGERMSSSL